MTACNGDNILLKQIWRFDQDQAYAQSGSSSRSIGIKLSLDRDQTAVRKSSMDVERFIVKNGTSVNNRDAPYKMPVQRPEDPSHA
jgi:hypothetical protein